LFCFDLLQELIPIFRRDGFESSNKSEKSFLLLGCLVESLGCDCKVILETKRIPLLGAWLTDIDMSKGRIRSSGMPAFVHADTPGADV
jgi:hypothetical protein